MRALALLLLVLLTGCDTDFRPETLVENLRLIGVSASPANLRPGESAMVSALVLDPSRAPQPSTVLWIGCAADPFNLNRSPCANPDVLRDSSTLSGGTGSLPEGVSIIGFGPRATYAVPATLFDPLAADDARRQSGTVGITIAFAVAETVSPAAPPEELQALFERVQRKEVKSVLALFRIAISESMVRNENPVVDALVVAGERWPSGARVLVREREPVLLDVIAPDSTFEPYEVSTPEGVTQKNEKVLTAWYSTAGRFSEERTTIGEDVKTIFTAPGSEKDPLPEGRTGTLFTVFRDTRGGQAWRTWPFFVCDDAASAPTIERVEWPAVATDPVVLHGASLENVVDVVVDGAALSNGAFSPATQTWRGFLPAGVELGVKRGVVHDTTCSRHLLPLL
ncbi:MAG: hypothetical protein U0228_21635 [Myxococcaceae bacterium]